MWRRLLCWRANSYQYQDFQQIVNETIKCVFSLWKQKQLFYINLWGEIFHLLFNNLTEFRKIEVQNAIATLICVKARSSWWWGPVNFDIKSVLK